MTWQDNRGIPTRHGFKMNSIVPLYETRESWLQAAVEQLRPWFAERGHQVPPVRVSIGFTSAGLRSTFIGQCWPTTLATDAINQIFIVPSLEDPVAVLDVLVHELVHAVDDCQNSHGKEFKKIAKSVGLEGHMRSAHAGKVLREHLTALSMALGPFPHGKLGKKAKRRAVAPRPRARCPECDYEVPMLKKFLDYGAPLCPVHKVEMEQIGDWETE